MTIEVMKYIRQLARTWVVLLMGAPLVCGIAGAQAPPVTTASVVTIPSNTSWGQIYHIAFYDGSVLALDGGLNALYQLSPGATAWETIGPSGGALGSSGGYTATGIALDAIGDLYITLRYTPSGTTPTGSIFLRVPYDPVGKTWKITSNSGWGSNLVDGNGNSITHGSDDVLFIDSKAKDGSGTLYWMSEDENIWSVPVDKTGNGNPNNTYTALEIVTGLVSNQGHLAVDVNGNIYFVEDHATTNAGRASGVFFIPVGDDNQGISGPNAEGQLERIDVSSNGTPSSVVYAGVTLDAAGNLYLISENNSNYDETFDGIWMIPNECGSPSAVTKASCLNFNHISLLSTFGGNNPVAIDSRGYIWAPSYHDPSADGSGPYPNVWAIVVLAPGSLNLGASPALTTGPTGTVPPGPSGTLFVTFNQPVTPTTIQLSQTGTGSDFAFANTDPNLSNPPPATPNECLAATQYTAQSSCEIWIGLNARAPGAVSGQLSMTGTIGTSTTTTYVPGSTVYLSGTGQGAEAAMLDSPAQPLVASEPQLQTPAQVAADAAGDTWVADPGLKQVVYFPAGSASSTGAPGTPIASSFTAPTGVAVDGSGDLYVADSGKVIEFPGTNGVPVIANKTVVASGLGANLNLAVDGAGDLYVADPANGRVVKVPNPAIANLLPNQAGPSSTTPIAVGAQFVQPPNIFTSPSAVAVDTSGDLFVADGTSLIELPPFGAATTITSSLAGSITGLAVDASGSVIISQKGGILRIPSVSGTLTVNAASPLAANTIEAPNGLAMDQSGNLYVSDLTSGQPNLFELAVTGAVDFGNALTPTEQTTAEVALFNIGNLPLTVTGNTTFSGPDAVAGDFAALTGGTCDPTGTTPVETGASCTAEVGFTPPATGTYSGDLMTVPTNAGNIAYAGNITATLSGTALQNLEPTQTAVTVTPPTSTYPGSTTATVTVTPAPTASVPATTNVPSGTVTLTLTNTSTSGTQQFTQQASGTDAGTTATFTLSGLQGGAYSITAAYAGNVGQLFKPSDSAAVMFTVAPAAPVITLSEPLGITPNAANGVYYVAQGQTSITLKSNVTAPAGAPGTATGTVVFTSGASLANNGATVGTSTLDANGNAVFNTGVLAIGSYSIFANYSGDQNYSAISSSAVAFQVVSASGVVLITASPTSLSTPAGTPVASTLTLYSVAGFGAANGANIACVNATLPYYSECTFSDPSPVICAPPGTTASPCSGSTTTVVTISSDIPVNLPPASASLQKHGQGTSPLIPAGIFGLGLFGLAMRRRAIFGRKVLNGVGLALMLLGITMGFGGCTNSSYTKTPPAQKYTTPSGTFNVSIQVTNPVSGAVQSLPFTFPVTIQAAQ
ncbi:MAG: Ig-like domain repeat protein [Terracidiphilus sp.]|jgi:sugar lactone lactonase YvrE